MSKGLFVLSVVFCLINCLKTHENKPIDTLKFAENKYYSFEKIKLDDVSSRLTQIFVVDANHAVISGFDGTILRYKNGIIQKEIVPTQENILAIFGAFNGNLFQMNGSLGELIAVGENSVVLHYNPNPDLNVKTNDGAWTEIMNATSKKIYNLKSIDLKCPDSDGDGIADDGDASGFAGDRLCQTSQYQSCDDNCKNIQNGTMLPILDTDHDFCIGPHDAILTGDDVQKDSDSNGIGDVCQGGLSGQERTYFEEKINDVWLESNGYRVQALGVGNLGSQLQFTGFSAAFTSTSGANIIADRSFWKAEHSIAFRYSDDCSTADVECVPSRPVPTCTAQCSPKMKKCPCDASKSTCCDPTEQVGAIACYGGLKAGCYQAENGCQGDDLPCDVTCLDCVRRHDLNLKGIAVEDDLIAIVGDDGALLIRSKANIDDPWTFIVSQDQNQQMNTDFTDIIAVDKVFYLIASNGSIWSYTVQNHEFTQIVEPSLFVWKSLTVVTNKDLYVAGLHGALAKIRDNQLSLIDIPWKENFYSIQDLKISDHVELLISGDNGVLYRVRVKS